VTSERPMETSLQRFQLCDSSPLARRGAAPMIFACPSRLGMAPVPEGSGPNPIGRSSGSLAFTTPPMTFCCCQPCLRGLPASDPSAIVRNQTMEASFSSFSAIFEAPVHTLHLAMRLSWDSSSCALPPTPCSVHSRSMSPSPFGVPAPTGPSCSALVVSRHLDGLLRVHVLEPVTARYRTGFAVFPEAPPDVPSCGSRRNGRGPIGTMAPFPDSAVHTLRRIPLASSRSASLRPLPSCRCHACSVLGCEHPFPKHRSAPFPEAPVSRPPHRSLPRLRSTRCMLGMRAIHPLVSPPYGVRFVKDVHQQVSPIHKRRSARFEPVVLFHRPAGYRSSPRVLLVYEQVLARHVAAEATPVSQQRSHPYRYGFRCHPEPPPDWRPKHLRFRRVSAARPRERGTPLRLHGACRNKRLPTKARSSPCG